jgi:hypothetical protein
MPDPIDVAALPKKHRRTVNAVFEKPTRSNVKWDSVVALVKRLGGTVSERGGSRKAFAIGTVVFVMHQPHPGNEVSKGALESFRAYLRRCGVKPVEPDDGG